MILPYRPLPSPQRPTSSMLKNLHFEFEKKNISKILILAFETNIMISQNCTFLDFSVMHYILSSDPQKVSFEGETFGQTSKKQVVLGGPLVWKSQ